MDEPELSRHQQQQGESPPSSSSAAKVSVVQSTTTTTTTTNSPSRLAALRRADDIVLHGGYASPSGRSGSPTHLLQRSNSIRQGVRSPPSAWSGTSSLPQSPISRSPRGPSTPEALESSPRIHRSTYTRSNTSISRKGGHGGGGRWTWLLWKRSGTTLCFLLLLFCFALDWWYLSTLRSPREIAPPAPVLEKRSQLVHEDGREHEPSPTAYDRLLALATHGLAEKELKPEPKDLWEEPTQHDRVWLPCANQQETKHISLPSPAYFNGYININVQGDFGQQQVAICDAVAVARMLNASLVLPNITLSNDSSQFEDLYMGDYFIDYLKEDVRVVKELPVEVRGFNVTEAVVTEKEIPKEAEPSFYIEHILPILLKTQVVIFEGFSERLGFDSVSFDIQRLRCRCNFHALRFTPELQRIGKLVAERMRDKHPRWGPGNDDKFEYEDAAKSHIQFAKSVPKYLAMHMNFDMDMAACDLQRRDLQAYVEDHFSLLAKAEHSDEKLDLASLQGELGTCPLRPEESLLVVAGLGFKRATRIYIASSTHLDIAIGQGSIMAKLMFLYPNMVIKEDILTHAELQPFRNHPSQLAVIDYMACASADMFLKTDSNISHLDSLVAGHRMYHGSGHKPTLRPSSALFRTVADTSEWSHFESEVHKAVAHTKRVHARRPLARSIYQHPRCAECMCEHHV